jgi:5'(3')-deoxyribonucleotidase
VYFFVILYFQISLFSAGELENLKSIFGFYIFFQKMYKFFMDNRELILRTFPFIKYLKLKIFSEESINKKIEMIYLKNYNS